jgi:hypothetical protein
MGEFHRCVVVLRCDEQSFATDLRAITKDHQRMKCYALGLGLDTFRMVALTENFRRLDIGILLSAFRRSAIPSFTHQTTSGVVCGSSVNLMETGKACLALAAELSSSMHLDTGMMRVRGVAAQYRNQPHSCHPEGFRERERE